MKNKYNILVTRPAHQAEHLCSLVNDQGWSAIRFPTLSIIAVDNTVFKQQIKNLGQHQWLIFISVNAVSFALKANNGKIDGFLDKPIAAVGKATAKALRLAGLTVALLPESTFNTEGLLATEEMQHVKGKSCLIIRGQGGREALADELRLRGAKVDYMEVYAREIPGANNEELCNMLTQNKVDAITITSGDALKNLIEMISVSLHDKLQAVLLIVVSERIKVLAEHYNFKHIAVTDNPGDTAIIKTIKMSLKTH